MSKYIIEIEEGKEGVMFCQSGIVSIGLHLKDEKSLRGLGIRSAIPYTEPDLEQVRKEAYQQGRKDGKIEGQVEAWVYAKKIVFNKARGGFTYMELQTIFGTAEMIEILEMSASEAIKKIRQYEQEKKEIQVGDEVITASGKAVVLGVGPVHFEYVNADGSNGFDKVKNAEKTGRHFPEIAEVLAKMKGEEADV